MTSPAVEILGIRHHGPGSARSIRRALEVLQPSVVVIEGPPELDALIEFADAPGLKPPVAGLVYDVNEPRRASFYPLATFSPEWVALRWALAQGVQVQFADLPAAHRLAVRDEAVDDADDPSREADVSVRAIDERIDPIGALAAAAGYDDAERWWEDAIEQRSPSAEPLDQFRALREAMTAFRGDDHTTAEQGIPARDMLFEREASMRKVLRKLVKDSAGPIAVVCGAFHAPVLHPDDWPTTKADNALLKGLAKTKVAATWAPWTSARLSYRSGYGAGVAAPLWYEHLFTATEDVIAHWMVRVGRLLRHEGYEASAASVVEATRLAETLASLRGRPLAGFAEVNDAAVTVLGHGSTASLNSISEELFVGAMLGTVPETTPLVPLASDMAKHQRSLRLKQSAEQKIVTLDLRKPAQLARSVFFHRLLLLDIGWALETNVGRSGGTFKEAWQLEWVPELAVSVIEASLYGTTVESAASSRVAARASSGETLEELAVLVESCLLADLPAALASVLDVMSVRTAIIPDQRALMMTIAPLARTRRYGDVRGIDTAVVHDVLATMVTRASIGLGVACQALNDDAASEMREAIESVDRAVSLVDDPHLVEMWRDAMADLSPTSIHGSVAGRVTRLLVDCGRLSTDEASQRLGRALSLALAPGEAAAWLDGFLAGDAVLMLHDPQLFGLIDHWVCDLDDSSFEDLLPLVRRTFSRFHKAERRQIGELVSRGTSLDASSVSSDELSHERAAPAVATVAELLGLGGPR